MNKPTLVKKYGNRRLYDSGDSRYVTIEELAVKVHKGTDVRVLDAKSGDDLTQQTLAQMLSESRGAIALMPAPVLTQLIRLSDEELAEFLERYVGATLELYLQNKAAGGTANQTGSPLLSLPFMASEALARLWMSTTMGAGQQSAPLPQRAPERSAQRSPVWQSRASSPAQSSPPELPPGPPPQPAGAAAASNDLARELTQMRREIAELKQLVLDHHKEPVPRRRPRSRKQP